MRHAHKLQPTPGLMRSQKTGLARTERASLSTGADWLDVPRLYVFGCGVTEIPKLMLTSEIRGGLGVRGGGRGGVRGGSCAGLGYLGRVA